MSELKTYTFWQLAQEYKIEIPIVQRDYAQGRDEPKANEVRDKFLLDLLSTLNGKQSIELDFVYGKVKDNIFIPIDGQQRLTTLFLLHWYIAVKAKKDFNAIGFSYKTRISAREFCKEFIKNASTFSIKDNSIIANEIKNASWFFISWEKDPSVKAMLKMLDTIHDKFKNENCDEIWEQLIILKQKPPISFKFLNLEAFPLTDELYLKMNARGKALSDFENFKAWLIGYVKNLTKENSDSKNKWCSGTLLDNWQNKMDGAWTDLFWQFKEDNLINQPFMRFFVEMGLLEYVNTETKKENEHFVQDIQNLAFTKKRKIDYYTNKYFEELNCFNLESLNRIFKTLDALIDNRKLKEFKEITDYFKLDSFFKLLKDKTVPITYPQRVYLYAFISYIIDDKTVNNNEQLFDWMRVIRNLVENTTIDNPTSFANAIKAITALQEFKDDILNNLALGNCDKVPVFGTQIKEEKIKATLILKNNNWRNPILDAENHSLFKGNIGFLLPDGENSDVNVFINRKDVALQLFDENGDKIGKDSYLLMRSVLSKYDGSKTKSITLIEDKSNWKKLLNNEFKGAIVQLLDDLKADSDYKNSLKTMCNNFDAQSVCVWQENLVKNEILLSKCSGSRIINSPYDCFFLYNKTNWTNDTQIFIGDNNRHQKIVEFIELGFQLKQEWQKVNNQFFKGGWRILMIKNDLELKFHIDKITIGDDDKRSYKFDEIEKLKTDFSNDFVIDTPSV